MTCRQTEISRRESEGGLDARLGNNFHAHKMKCVMLFRHCTYLVVV